MSKIQPSLDVIFNNPELKKEGLRREIFKIFNIYENKNYDHQTSTVEKDEEVTRWLNKNGLHFITSQKETFNKRTFFKNEIDKVSYLTQFHCKICCLDGLTIFPIRINPQTRQTKTELKNKFQEHIKNSPYGRNFTFESTDRICVKIVFVMRDGKDKDLDNMAKTTLDGIKELIKIDDKNIDHLDLIKIRTKYIEDHIHLSIGKSDIYDPKNILLKGANLGWAGLERMEV